VITFNAHYIFDLNTYTGYGYLFRLHFNFSASERIHFNTGGINLGLQFSALSGDIGAIQISFGGIQVVLIGCNQSETICSGRTSDISIQGDGYAIGFSLEF
jgi:hypothetical protein